MIMLDTNICIYILQKHPHHIRRKFNAVESVHISSVVYAELRYGLEYGSKRLRAAREKQLNQFLVLLTIAVESVHISSVVYAELRYGLEYGSKRLRAAREKQLNQFLVLLTIHDWNKQAAEQYGEVNAFLREKGMMIGNMDMLIAAHALSLKATLITDNSHEFQRIPDLKLENWHSE